MKNKFLVSILKNMNIEEKIGLTFTVICEGGTYLPGIAAFIKQYHCGGLRVVPAQRYGQKMFIDRTKRENGLKEPERIYLTTSVNNPPNVSLQQYSETIKKYQLLAGTRKNGIPLRIAFDQEGGFSRDMTFGGTPIFPVPMGITASGDPRIAYEIAKALGRIGRAVGMNMIHSPVLDINVEPNNPEIYTRAYSDIPEVVAEFALEAARGFKEAGMLATGKHFPGRGDSIGDAHFDIPVLNMDWDTLWNRELYPYRVLIENDLLPVIMTAHSIYPAVDSEEIATLSEKMLKGVLRDKLGFKGVITTDAIGMKGVTLRYDVPEACLKALKAGADMLLMRMSTEEPIGPVIPKTVEKIMAAIECGEFKESELDEKVYRILQSYYDAGLFQTGGSAGESIKDVLEDPHVIAVTETASARNVYVYRDNDKLLPLKQKQRALVIEQRVPRQFCPNDGFWYHGMFYDRLCEFSDELSYIETGISCSVEEEEMIFRHLDNYDIVIMTNWYYRNELGSNIELVKRIANAGKKVIVVGDTPYEQQCIPKEAGTAIIQFGVTPVSIRTVAEVIYGKTEPKAVWPINYKP